MIDTIILNPKQYTISDNHQLTLKQGDLSPEGVELYTYELFKTEGGHSYLGKKAFYNDQDRNVIINIVPCWGAKWCFIKCSLPKILFNNNYYTISRDEFCAGLDILQERLVSIGIKIDIFSSHLSRLDLFKNIDLNYPIQYYFPLLETLRFKRTKRMKYFTTNYWRNNQNELTAYDKIAEMNSRGIDTSDLPPDVLRFELRLLKRRKIVHDLGISSVNQLIENFDLLPSFLSKKLCDLFDIDFRPFIEGGTDLETKIRRFQTCYSMKYFHNFLCNLGMKQLEESDKLLDCKNALLRIDGNSRKFDLALKSYEDIKAIEIITKNANGQNLLELFQEIQEKASN